jgi:hypothetical protein
MSDGYNGYTNYETWVTALWMDNEPHTNEFLYELANNNPIPRKRFHTSYDDWLDAMWNKAKILEEYVKDMILSDPPNGLGTDLLTHAISGINWQEIIEVHTEEEVEEIPSPPLSDEDARREEVIQ